MMKLLPPRNSVCLVFNSFVQNPDKTWPSGELDFYIDVNLKYAIELLRRGHKIGKHVNRFDPPSGNTVLFHAIFFLLWRTKNR
jgi:hypothetical protein